MREKRFSVAKVIPEDTINSDDISYTIFFQGCSRDCIGCHNPELQEFKEPNYSANEIIEDIRKYPLCKNIVFTGGEPIENSYFILFLVYYLKEVFPDKKLWIYTGRDIKLDELNDIEPGIFNDFDVIKSGPYIETERDLSLKFRGSKNQTLYKRNEEGEFIEWKV